MPLSHKCRRVFIVGWCDSKPSRKSTSCHYIMCNDALVHWRSRAASILLHKRFCFFILRGQGGPVFFKERKKNRWASSTRARGIKRAFKSFGECFSIKSFLFESFFFSFFYWFSSSLKYTQSRQLFFRLLFVFWRWSDASLVKRRCSLSGLGAFKQWVWSRRAPV
jgi:hypothetical protein